MKNGKCPTRGQKKFLKSLRLNPDNWLVVKNSPSEVIIVHRHSGQQRTIPQSLIGGKQI